MYWRCNLFMPGVTVRNGEPFEKALKRFKKSCEKAGIISDMKKHQHLFGGQPEDWKRYDQFIRKGNIGDGKRASSKLQKDRYKKLFFKPFRPNFNSLIILDLLSLS